MHGMSFDVGVGSVLRCFLLALQSVLFVAFATLAVAQNSPIVSNVFFQSDLRQALEDVAAQAKVNIVADQNVQGVVSVTLENVTVEKALQLLLAGTDYQVQVTPDYYLVYSPDEATGLFPQVAKTRMVTLQGIAPDVARGLLAQSLQRYVRVDAASNSLAVTAPQALLDRIIEDLKTIDQSAADNSDYVALQYVKAATLVSLLPQNLQRFVRADSDRNTLAITASSAIRRRIIEQIGRLDVPLAPGNFDVPNVHRTQVVKLKNAKALSTLKLLPEALATYVRADEESNTLAISAPRQVVKGILADIAAIDAPRKHIMLDARVVVLERSDLLDFGADWKLPQITAGAALADGLGFPWEMMIGYSPNREFTDALSLTLNLLTQNDEATIIASPQVLAQDGKEAEIKVTTEEYFQITSEAGAFLRADLEKIETGTILRITPQVGGDGKLTLDMNIEVSDVVARGKENLPVISRRTARSTVQIESGGTAAIAGLLDSRSQFGKAGVPGASGLPLLGRAFRTDTLNHQARQVAVFVTATSVDPDESRLGSAKVGPHVATVNTEVYRQELQAALDALNVGR
jgi:type II secretory pathway component GspD/PulD (secretin)